MANNYTADVTVRPPASIRFATGMVCTCRSLQQLGVKHWVVEPFRIHTFSTRMLAHFAALRAHRRKNIGPATSQTC